MKMNIRQKKVIEAKENKIICLATAASGKTRCLTERIRRILNDGCQPENIAAITFTSMAADEMKERLGEQGYGMFIGTIHSLANNILIENGIDTTEIIKNEIFDTLLKKT